MNQSAPGNGKSRHCTTSRLLGGVRASDGSGCLIWNGATCDRGYGRICLHGKVELVHRIAYQLWAGPIPAGMTVDHLCGVKRCINPEHMEIVSRSENGRRGGLANIHGRWIVPEYGPRADWSGYQI